MNKIATILIIILLLYGIFAAWVLISKNTFSSLVGSRTTTNQVAVYTPLEQQSTSTASVYLPLTTIVKPSQTTSEAIRQDQKVIFESPFPTVITTVDNGTSMLPLLSPGNIIVLAKEVLTIGDVGVYTYHDGHDVIHRLIGEEKGMYIFKGDNNLLPDKPVSKDKITWRLKAVIY